MKTIQDKIATTMQDATDCSQCNQLKDLHLKYLADQAAFVRIAKGEFMGERKL